MKPKRPINWLFVLVAIALTSCVLALSQCKGAWVFPSASAGETQLTWVAPTKNCDGTALTNLAKYDLTYGQARQDLPLSPLSKTITGLTPGTWWFSLAAVNAAGESSQFVTATKTVLPSEFVVASPDAFALVKRVDRIVLSKVGTVPVGTVCNAAETVNGKYVVPKAAVTWSSLVRADVVVASCK